MKRFDYMIARRVYRELLHRERTDRAAYASSVEASLRSLPGPPCTPESTRMLGCYSKRDRAALLARPVVIDGRLPRGPRASAIFDRGDLPLNKRVVLRRAIREIDAYTAGLVQQGAR